MSYKLLWAGLLALLSGLLTVGLPDPPGRDPGTQPGQTTSSQEGDKGGGTDPNGLTAGGEHPTA